MPIPFARLYDHLKWADRKVLESLRAAKEPPARVIELYSHVVAAEHVWLSRIHSRPAKVAVWPMLTLDECEAMTAANTESFDGIIRTLDPARLATQISYRNSAGEGFTSKLEDILLHVPLHGSYHRGQIAMILRNADEIPAPTDFIAFARGSPAATRTNR